MNLDPIETYKNQNKSSVSLIKHISEERNYNMTETISSPFEILKQLQYGWDFDNAPNPNNEAIKQAEYIVENIKNNQPDEIDPDAVGGVTLFFYSKNDNKYIMISIRNTGKIIFSLNESKKANEVKVFIDSNTAIEYINYSLSKFYGSK